MTFLLNGTVSCVLAGPNLNGMPLNVNDEPSRLAEKAPAPPSRPLWKVVPSVTIPLLMNPAEMSTGRTGGVATDRLSLKDRVIPPDVPLIVTKTGSEATDFAAESCNVLVPAASNGLKDAVTPLGRPDADKLTL